MPRSESDPGPTDERTPADLERRGFLAALSSVGVGGALFPGVLWARAQDAGEITPGVIAEAEKIAGLELTPEEREMMLSGLREYRDAYEELRRVSVSTDVAPALTFRPDLPPGMDEGGASLVRPSVPGTLPDPADPSAVAFASVVQLGALLREGRVTAVELARLSLDRLRRYDPVLRCVVTLTEALALEQAAAADRELAEGRDRGPLHGIPWGAKDLLSVRGLPTTWGASAYRERVFDSDATVVRRLEEAGAVLVAKLSLGELAMGDEWYGGRTRNPWNPEQGSSGSSAGSAAATAAGLVAFSLGSETLGSIVSPSARCGVTGLRPTFGRVSRHGAMPLAWSMDKVGPICRTAEDCAIVLGAIAGPDGLDPSVRDVPFRWDGEEGTAGLRVGYLREAFEANGSPRELDTAALESLAAMDVTLRPVEIPGGLPLRELRLILDAEAAAALDELTRENVDDTLVGQDEGDWPNLLRTARFVPAVEYIRANRIRSMLMDALREAWADLDVVVAPTRATGLLMATNLTGHPQVVVPHGRGAGGTPSSLSFVGMPWRDEAALRLARAFQEATDHHLGRPPGFA